MVLGIVVALAVVAGAAIYAFSKKVKGHAAATQEHVNSRGYTLDPTIWKPVPSNRFDHFLAVSDEKVSRTLEHPDSGDSAFEYKFDLRTGDVGQKHRRTCALVTLPFAVPSTTLRPRSQQTIPAQPIDADDVLFGLPELDEKFRLQSFDEGFARNALQREVTSWLQTSNPHGGCVEIELRDEAMLFVGPRLDEIDEVIDFLEWAQGVRDRLSESVEAAPRG